MSDYIDQVCERIESADEKTAVEILLSLTQIQMHEVKARLEARLQRSSRNLEHVKRALKDINA